MVEASFLTTARNNPLCFLRPERLTPYSAWREHIPFALFLTELLKPDVFVELGSHYGDSYLAFCQAVRHCGLGTQCHAVDRWEGDAHAGAYGEDVLGDLRAHHDPRYGSFSKLLQCEFDDAAKRFADGTVDLLHIDGYHTYEAVKHDFETWLPKMSGRGVMLFHDTEVRKRDFGVWKLWEEVRSRYPHFSFTHGHGLGVLAVGQHQSPAVRQLFGASESEAAEIRQFFSELGRRLRMRKTMRSLKKRLMLVSRLARQFSRRRWRFARLHRT